VIAVTSSASKARALYSAGADEVVVPPALDVSSAVRRLTGGDGVQIAIAIAIAIEIEIESGTIELNPGLVIVEELEILGVYATTQGELETARRLSHAGKLSPYVTDVLPLGDAAKAHVRLENREVAGRLVLCPDPDPA
jgi:acryloyl-coenzyme A reductase